MNLVLIEKARYDYRKLKPQIDRMCRTLAGDRIQAGMRVLVKPNLLMAARPAESIVTHPRVVRAVVEFLLGKGARVQISDSPAMGSFDRILRLSGYLEALEGLDVDLRPFKGTVSVDVGKPFGRIEVARDAIAADAVVNLCKLKTHAQMLLTLGVKNLFGCVVGFAKPQWHLRCGIDRDHFARLLVRIQQAVNPCLTIMDGIFALQGQGPGKSGRPRFLGVLAAGRSAPAVDAAVCRLLGLNPQQLATHRAAVEMGLLPADMHIRGDFNMIDDFELPRMAPTSFGPPAFNRFMRRHVLQKPVANDKRCERCGRCQKYCPAKAVAVTGSGVVFDYNRCIRCYCCVEICPCGALTAQDPLAGRVLHRLSVLK